ncbi:MAG: hypothetical protein EZS28_037869 [Streblomastix strix]|uniref:Uncharacterized protein n=1 Tax=Streblomastix strix TaxID=222440 RepID=A0A5J4U8R6_9EUKA|nr:MAG: hypothetical protein EZS28_037869 [Streblomastix strix]
MQLQTELINVGYVQDIMISFSTAGGIGEQQDDEIYWGLDCVSEFFNELHNGRNNYLPSFPPQPGLSRICEEQIEEEDGNEEVESQLFNQGYDITDQVYLAKRRLLNYFIDICNLRPTWYW